MHGERPLAPLGGPTQFATGPVPQLLREEALVGPAARVAQPDPGEVEDFMDEDAGEFGGVGDEIGVEGDAPLTEEGSGVHGTAWIGKSTSDFEADGTSVDRRKTAN